MIRLDSSEYFHPTKDFRQLSILLAMYNEPDIRQHGIAAEVNMSGAMVNTYIKRLKNNGYITVKKKNRRDLEYQLTSTGREQLVYHLMECSAEIVQLYSQAKNELIKRLQDVFSGKQHVRVFLYGGSETGRLVLESLELFTNVKVIAVVDSDVGKWGKSVGAHIVQGPEILKTVEVDYVIIASFARQNEIYDSLMEECKTTARILRLSSL